MLPTLSFSFSLPSSPFSPREQSSDSSYENLLRQSRGFSFDVSSEIREGVKRDGKETFASNLDPDCDTKDAFFFKVEWN